MTVSVGCYTTPTGAPVDRRFTVLFLQPAEHLAYAWTDAPTYPNYSPYPVYSWNPAREPITVTRTGVGRYTVAWQGLSAHIFSNGITQVTAYGEDGAQRESDGSVSYGHAHVLCFAANGAPVDARFTVLRGS